uniref:Uncharacterized protein n=1 Tax=Ditylenchus dipsaci TaxID=166011 RepID=A0A915CYS9_9BILA
MLRLLKSSAFKSVFLRTSAARHPHQFLHESVAPLVEKSKDTKNVANIRCKCSVPESGYEILVEKVNLVISETRRGAKASFAISVLSLFVSWCGAYMYVEYNRKRFELGLRLEAEKELEKAAREEKRLKRQSQEAEKLISDFGRESKILFDVLEHSKIEKFDPKKLASYVCGKGSKIDAIGISRGVNEFIGRGNYMDHGWWCGLIDILLRDEFLEQDEDASLYVTEKALAWLNSNSNILLLNRKYVDKCPKSLLGKHQPHNSSTIIKKVPENRRNVLQDHNVLPSPHPVEIIKENYVSWDQNKSSSKQTNAEVKQKEKISRQE